MISMVAERSGRSSRRILRIEEPVRSWTVREMARAVNTIVRWASIASRVWWKIGYADLPVMPTSGVNVLVRALARPGRSA